MAKNMTNPRALQPICSISDCSSGSRIFTDSHAWVCGKHAQRIKKYGNPEFTKTPATTRREARPGRPRP